MRKLELLAPAGSPEAARAAVLGGADSVYLGLPDFNARRGAKNFTEDELSGLIIKNRARGVKTYLTLNTVLTDRELIEAAQTVRAANRMGVDALIVADLGVMRMVRQVAPSLPVHASTQLSAHNLEGVKKLAKAGFSRVILARELPAVDLSYICKNSPVDIEVFAHGSLCVCFSGMCYMSSVIGCRSGNRGLCAQPCRLPYTFSGSSTSYPEEMLSLKDLALGAHLDRLAEIGVNCLKIEGRMKRPEYVGAVTAAYAKAIDQGRSLTPAESMKLAAVFSRDGFTDGYFIGDIGKRMFGVRCEEENSREYKRLLAGVRSSLALKEREAGRIGVSFMAIIRKNEQIILAVTDNEGRRAVVKGQKPELAAGKPITARQVAAQLEKTGGTPYVAAGCQVVLDDMLSLPLSAINMLRRECLDKLTGLRSVIEKREEGEFRPLIQCPARPVRAQYTIEVTRVSQLTDAVMSLSPAIVYIPVDEILEHPDEIREMLDMGVYIAARLPRIVFDSETQPLMGKLSRIYRLGIRGVLTSNYGLLAYMQAADMAVHGDFALNIMNSTALREARVFGFASCTLSFEAGLGKIRDILPHISAELIVYGRLPLMITHNCVIKNHYNNCTACKSPQAIVDRTGAAFPVLREGERNVILNSHKLYLADKLDDFWEIGLSYLRLMFTTENPIECTNIAECYLGSGGIEPSIFTRGLYYRDVE